MSNDWYKYDSGRDIPFFSVIEPSPQKSNYAKIIERFIQFILQFHDFLFFLFSYKFFQVSCRSFLIYVFFLFFVEELYKTNDFNFTE